MKAPAKAAGTAFFGQIKIIFVFYTRRGHWKWNPLGSTGYTTIYNSRIVFITKMNVKQWVFRISTQNQI